MSREFLRKSSELAAEGKPFAVATVVRVEGSSSARPGSKAIIDDQGKLVMGWVGGGCAEGAVKRQALECIARQRPQLITLDMTDEVLGVGMPCGGIMDVYIDPVLPKPELLIVGHGRIAETLAALARLVNFSVTVDDPSADRTVLPRCGPPAHRRSRLERGAHRFADLRGDCHAAQGRSHLAAESD